GRARKALEAAREEIPRHLAHARLGGAHPLTVALSACTFCAPEASALNAALEALGFVELLMSASAPIRAGVCSAREELDQALKALGGATPSVYALIEDDDPRHETLH